MRLQQRFATGLRRGFITHLKLKGIWDKLDIKEQNLELMFNPPTNFYELRENQKFEMKSQNYTSISNSEFISNTFAQKKYLGWKDTDILANREFLRKDSELQWELQQIASSGPAWKEAIIAGDLGAGAAGGEATDAMGGGGGGSGGAPPEFGGGEASTDTPAEVPADDAAAQPESPEPAV
jgi:hypothetical protein